MGNKNAKCTYIFADRQIKIMLSKELAMCDKLIFCPPHPPTPLHTPQILWKYENVITAQLF